MIDRVTFTGGLSKLALQLNKPAEKQLLLAYFEAMEDETDPAEWLDFVRVAAKRWGSSCASRTNGSAACGSSCQTTLRG